MHYEVVDIAVVGRYCVAMYIETVPNRGSRPAILLRDAHREGAKVIKRTVANLSAWPDWQVDALRQILRGERLVAPDAIFEISGSVAHGHVDAVLRMIRRLGVDRMIASRPSRERDLVVAMVVARLVFGCSKLATTRLWEATSLGQECGVADAGEDELYAALDWLAERKVRIERKLAGRHLEEGGQALYDVSSSTYEGRHCPLAAFGHNRDGKRGKRSIVYGLMTDAEGRPVSVSVYAGNTGDPATIADQVAKLGETFGLDRVVLVGDRGMLTAARIDAIRAHGGLGWISCLRSSAIRGLVREGALQLSLFEEQGLAEIVSEAYPGERLVACFNPLLADERARKREELLATTEGKLVAIGAEVSRRTRTPMSVEEVARKVERVMGRYKMAKHFTVTIAEGTLAWTRKVESIAVEASLDGIYVIRTSEPADRMSADDAVRSYKNLSRVERAFRTLKGADIEIRPIHHHRPDRVEAHIFLCVLAYYVEWHLRQAWAELLFDDQDPDGHRARRDPVAPAASSDSATAKRNTGRTADGRPVQSFRTLMKHLAAQAKVRCTVPSVPSKPQIERVALPTDLQARAFELIDAFPVPRT